MAKLNLFYWTTMTILIVAGSLWHLITVCILHLSYPTNVVMDTNFETDAKVLPAMTFCANICNITKGRTTSEIFSEINPRQIFIDIFTEFIHVKNQDLREYSLDHILETLSLRYYCFTINSSIKGNKLIKLSLNQILKVRLNKINANGSWWIFMHNSLDIPSSYEWNAIEVKEGHIYEVTYSLKTFHLLESPYPTNCKIFSSKTKFMSHKDCVRQCRRQAMEDNCGFLSHEVDVYKCEGSALFANSLEDQNCSKALNLREVCLKMCSNVDCVKYHYKPLIISNREHESRVIDVDVMIPSDPIVSYFHRPQIQTIEFLCYIASILSLWFGFSFLSFCFWIKDLYFKINEIVLCKTKSIKIILCPTIQQNIVPAQLLTTQPSSSLPSASTI